MTELLSSKPTNEASAQKIPASVFGGKVHTPKVTPETHCDQGLNATDLEKLIAEQQQNLQNMLEQLQQMKMLDQMKTVKQTKTKEILKVIKHNEDTQEEQMSEVIPKEDSCSIQATTINPAMFDESEWILHSREDHTNMHENFTQIICKSKTGHKRYTTVNRVTGKVTHKYQNPLPHIKGIIAI